METCDYCHRRAIYQEWVKCHDKWGDDLRYYCESCKPDNTNIDKVENRTLEIRRAIRNARRINSMLQGTMGIEGQALDPKQLREMKRRTIMEILNNEYS